MKKLALTLALTLSLCRAAAGQPAPVPALPDATRLTQYAISGTTCACSVGFALYGDGTDVDNWLQVFIGSTRVLSTDPSFGWAITSASGALGSIARPVTNGVLTFNAVQTGTVTIVGARRPRRLSQFSESRGVAARDLNQIVTDIVAEQREAWDRDARTIMGQPGEVLNLLPPAASRAGAVLAFDGSGRPVIQPNVPAGSIPVNSITKSLLAQMAANTIKGNNTGGTANAADLTVPQVAAMLSAPQVTVLTSGSGTYTTPANAKYITVEIVGGGGGAGGGGGSGGTGGTGTASTFGVGLTANGGGGNGGAGSGGSSGGAGSGGDVNITGQGGQTSFGAGAASAVLQGPQGANSPLYAGGGSGGWPGGPGAAGTVNTGSGGGGGGSATAGNNAGGAGAGGAYVKKLIASPAATYAYAVGPGGTGGVAGTGSGAAAGGAGGSGIIIVTAYFQ